MMKLKITIACSLLIFALHATQDKKTSSHFGKGPGHPKKQREMCDIYNASAMYHPTAIKDWDMFTSLSFLYWHVKEDCFSFGVRFDPEIVFNTLSGFTYGKLDFSYKPGFKIAVGTSLGHDGWQASAEYTWLHMTTDSATLDRTSDNPTSNAQISTLFEPNLPNRTVVITTTASWGNDLDLLDFELARPFYSGKALILKPFIGPRFFWNSQTYRQSLVPDPGLGLPDFASVRWRAKTWALGFRAGSDFKWEVGYGLRLFGDFAGSLLYRSQKVTSRFNGTSTDSVPANVKTRLKIVKPNADINAGIGWGSYFHEGFWHFDVAIGYSFLYFWGENGIQHIADQIDDFSCHKAGDLMFHGLDITLRFDF